MGDVVGIVTGLTKSSYDRVRMNVQDKSSDKNSRTNPEAGTYPRSGRCGVVRKRIGVVKTIQHIESDGKNYQGDRKGLVRRSHKGRKDKGSVGVVNQPKDQRDPDRGMCSLGCPDNKENDCQQSGQFH
jgi:hypothetical protein